MNFDDYKNLVKNSRATRRFKKDIKIDNKELEEVIDVVRLSSSPKNMQPLKYVTVTNQEYVEKLSETSLWATHLEDWQQSPDERPSAYIIILNDTSIEGYPMLDCGIALNSIILALKTKGYASCALGSIDKELCKDIFYLQEKIEPMVGIAIGIEDETIKIVNVNESSDEDTNYYRNEKDEHCVPKRDLKEVLIGKF